MKQECTEKMWSSTPLLHTSLDTYPEWNPFLPCTSVAVFPPHCTSWSLFPLHLSLLSWGVLPLGLVVEHSVVKMGMGGVVFVDCLAGVEGCKPIPLCLHFPSWEVTAGGDTSPTPTEPQCLLYQTHIHHPPVSSPLAAPSHPPLTLCSRQDETHCALKVESGRLPC